MFEIIDILVAIGAGATAASYLTKKGKKEEVAEKINEIKTQVVQSESPVKLVDSEVVHRLDALEDLIQSNQPMGVSSELISVKVLYIQDGIRYHFHYLHRPQPFLTLTCNKAKQQVIRDYVMEDLAQDKRRLKEIVKSLSDKIIEENDPQREALSKMEEHTDPVYKKAYHILAMAKQMDTQLLPSEGAYIRESVENILTAYEPLKEETKKQCQDDVFLALGKLENRLKANEDRLEKEKMKRLKEQMNEL